ncbi:hypothetical protein HP439_07730 [Sphingobacterium shayense]|uniref:hypothetical protein n=1 Tax=Sphingobacterium shayense TaxID=626343 RepID=UPI001552785B|nr:hypothetical protein [Sphingobacterium shayense]NQD70605.1 hypothetical protein [Sphingobacterium shayense]
MQFDDIVDPFVASLEQGLDITLKRRMSSHGLILSSKDPAFTIILYYPDKLVERLENHASKTFHIDIDQLISASEKIVPRLLSLFGKGDIIYARRTVVARIDKKVAIDFQKEHHLQAPLAGKYRYGLFFNGDIVSIAVFSGGRHMRDRQTDYRSFELLRFCHKSGLRVVGGLSKLMSAFIKDFKPNDIMTYVDRDWANESTLVTVGFSARTQTPPQQFWIADGNRHHVKNQTALEELKKILPHGYLIHNSGSSKLILELP